MAACYLLTEVPGEPFVHANLQDVNGLVTVFGFVSDAVAEVRLIQEDGQHVVASPAPLSGDPRVPYRAFIAVVPAADWVLKFEAFDASGVMIGSVDMSDHLGRFVVPRTGP